MQIVQNIIFLRIFANVTNAKHAILKHEAPSLYNGKQCYGVNTASKQSILIAKNNIFCTRQRG